MRDRSEQILRLVCLALAVLLAVQLAKIALRINPLHGVVIPALPTLASDTNAPAGKGTNALASLGKETNKIAGTNVAAMKMAKEKGTNAAAQASGNVAAGAGKSEASTNLPLRLATTASETNSPNMKIADTNSVTSASTNQISTNTFTSVDAAISNAVADAFAAPVEISTSTNSSPKETNSFATVETTNLPQESTNFGTNITRMASTKNKTQRAHDASGTNSMVTLSEGTNSSAKSKTKGIHSAAPSAMAMGGMNFGPAGMRGGGPAPELPPEIKARVIRIYESELFGQVMHPMPMALMGIAGNTAFLRAPSGQTGLVKEGDSLGEIKLLRIGINRVLVEENGEKKELMIFNGYGGESLLTKESDTKNEHPHTSSN